MSNVDQFESMFRAAEREVFGYERIGIESVLMVTDLDAERAGVFGERVRSFLSVLDLSKPESWRVVPGRDFGSAAELLELVQAAKPDLICSYRNLHSNAWRWPYSLGTHLDLLTQHTDVPVLVVPHPEAEREAEHALEDTNTVMAITDHLTGDDRLVNYGLRMTAPGGVLWLTHIEDEATFDRYVEAISKIPTIDTDTAREALHDRLLKEPRDFIEGIRQTLEAESLRLKVESVVAFGRHLSQYRSLIETHEVDMLVLNTKNEDQLAMHGIAYELAVELRHIPLLML